MKTLLLALILFSEFGCATRSSPPVAGRKRLEVWSPVAYATNLPSNVSVLVKIGALGNWTRAELELQFAGKETLILIREGLAVPSTLRFAPNPESEAPGVVLELTPQVALSDGWYELHLASPLLDQSLASAFGFQKDARGNILTRFRVGPGPVLRLLSYCPSDEIVRVSVSEPVSATRSATALALAPAGESMKRNCVPSSKIPQPIGGADLYFDCGPLMAGAFDVSVDAESNTGLRVGEFDSAKPDFSRAVELRPSELNNDCLAWYSWGTSLPQAVTSP